MTATGAAATARRLRVAVQVQPQHATYAELRDAVLRAEDAGVDVVHTWDHFFPLRGDPDGAHLECWSLLAAWAERTERVELGALVSAIGYRNPDLLADMARTVDHISGGRLVLGVGAGWFERDYAEYGYEFGTAGSRLKDLDASLPIIKRRWEALNPAPVRGSIPILIGGGGEKVTLRLTAQHANMWNSFGPPETYRHKNQVLNDWCAQLNRDPAAIERTVSIGKSNELDRLEDFVAAGAQHIILEMGAPFEMTNLKRLLAWRDRQG